MTTVVPHQRRKEALTPEADLLRLLQAAGSDLVLVGGQALAFWVQRYGIALQADVAAISCDVDFLTPSAADRAVVERMARVLKGKAVYPNRRALTALVGQAYRDVNDEEFVNVDIIFKVLGLPQQQVRSRAVQVQLEGAEFFVMHPLDVLRSRLANLYHLKDRQNDKGLTQLALAIEVVRHFLRAMGLEHAGTSSALRSPLQPYISEIERLACEDAGRKVAKRYGVHVADAIDPSLISAPAFWQRKWPTLKALMSGGYAAQFAPPALH